MGLPLPVRRLVMTHKEELLLGLLSRLFQPVDALLGDYVCTVTPVLLHTVLLSKGGGPIVALA